MNFQLCFMFLLVFRWGWPALISGLRICFPKSGRTIPAATLPCRASACAFTPFDGATPAFSRCSRFLLSVRRDWLRGGVDRFSQPLSSFIISAPLRRAPSSSASSIRRTMSGLKTSEVAQKLTPPLQLWQALICSPEVCKKKKGLFMLIRCSRTLGEEAAVRQPIRSPGRSLRCLSASAPAPGRAVPSVPRSSRASRR